MKVVMYVFVEKRKLLYVDKMVCRQSYFKTIVTYCLSIMGAFLAIVYNQGST